MSLHEGYIRHFDYYNVSHTCYDYESYRMLAQGATAHSVTDDPYEFIYQYLPQRHRLRNVLDCHYCGVMRFQYEPPGFVVEREK